MSWPSAAAPAMAVRGLRVASVGTGGGGVGGRRVPVAGGLGMGVAVIVRCGEFVPPMGGWPVVLGYSVPSWPDGRGGGGRLAAAGGELHLPGPAPRWGELHLPPTHCEDWAGLARS
jgi:hypothetical protein